MLELLERVKNIARGAALMTGTEVDIHVLSAVSNLLGNEPLEQAMYETMLRLGAPEWDDADRAFAREIQATLSPGDLATAYRKVGVKPKDGVPLCDAVVPRNSKRQPMIGSTDVGDVSWVVADGAGACADLRDRHAGPLMAVDGAGQVAARA